MINFLYGIVTSFGVWWLTNKLLSPRIGISSHISSKNNKSFIKIQNKSFFREIYDIDIYGRYHFASGNFYAKKITHVALLKKKPWKKFVTEEKKPYETMLPLYAPSVNRIGTCSGLDAFFDSEANQRDGYVDIIIVGYDKFTGSTRHAKLRRYYYKDIKAGYFQEGSLEVIGFGGGIQVNRYGDNY